MTSDRMMCLTGNQVSYLGNTPNTTKQALQPLSPPCPLTQHICPPYNLSLHPISEHPMWYTHHFLTLSTHPILFMYQALMYTNTGQPPDILSMSCIKQL